MYSLRAMAPYPIKQGARAIWRASQSSDCPTSRMYRLYAVQAIVMTNQLSGVEQERKWNSPIVSGWCSISCFERPKEAQ